MTELDLYRLDQRDDVFALVMVGMMTTTLMPLGPATIEMEGLGTKPGALALKILSKAALPHACASAAPMSAPAR